MIKTICKAELTDFFKNKLYLETLFELQVVIYLVHGHKNFLEVKIAPSKFHVLDSSSNKELKNRQVMSLMDIISLLCLTQNHSIDKYKQLCMLNSFLVISDTVQNLSLDLIKTIYRYDTNTEEINKCANKLNLDVYTILLKLRGNVESLADIVARLHDAYKTEDFQTAFNFITFKSAGLATLRDGLSLLTTNFKTTIVSQIVLAIWGIHKKFFLSEGDVEMKAKLFDSIKVDLIFSDFANQDEIEEIIAAEREGLNTMKLLEKKENQIEIYKRLNRFSKYPCHQLIKLLNSKEVKKDENFLKTINHALLESFDLELFYQLKNNLSLTKEDESLNIEVFNAIRFLHDIKCSSNLCDNAEIQTLLEPFKTELIKTNIFDEFKKQKDIQTGLKFSGINKKGSASSEQWRNLISFYITNDNNLLKLLAFFDYIDNNLESAILQFFENKVNLIGITTNVLLFLYSYFEYVTSEERKAYVSADSFAGKVGKVQMLIDVLIGIFLKLMRGHGEPLNENLYTLGVFIKYYRLLSIGHINGQADAQIVLDKSNEKKKKIVELIFVSFKIDQIWYQIFEIIKTGGELIYCLNLIVEGLEVINTSQLQIMTEYLLQKRQVNDKLITYNYTKEIDHYLKIAKCNSIFDLILDIILKHSDAWISANQHVVQKLFHLILSNVQIETYDFMYLFITSKFDSALEKLTTDLENQDRHIKLTIFILEIIYSMTQLNHVKSYMLSRKFTTEIIKIEKAIASMAHSNSPQKMKLITILNWKILSVLCNPEVGIRRLVSGSKSDKTYVEDMPIETHLLEIFGLIFLQLPAYQSEISDRYDEELLAEKLEVLTRVLGNNQGKNVLQQYCIINKTSKLLGSMFSSFAEWTPGIKGKLVNILYDFRKIKDFKNLYLLDKLICSPDFSSVDESLKNLEELLGRLMMNVKTSESDMSHHYQLAIQIMILNDFAAYVLENKKKILKNSYKTPKLTFNNEMPEDIRTRFNTFRATRFYEKDFKQETKSSIKRLDMNRLSEEISKRMKPQLFGSILSEEHFKDFKFEHNLNTVESYDRIRVHMSRAKNYRSTAEPLLVSNDADSKLKIKPKLKIGTVIIKPSTVKRQPERKISLSQSDNEKEPVDRPIVQTQVVHQMVNPMNGLGMGNPLLSFISNTNTAKIPNQPQLESGGSLLLQNLTPNTNSNKQYANQKMQGIDISNQNMGFLPPLIPNMPHFGFMPGPMMPNQSMSQFPPFINPMMPNIPQVANMMPKPYDNSLNKRQQQDFYQVNNNYPNNPNPQSYNYNSFAPSNLPAPYNAIPEYSRKQQASGSRKYVKRDRISPELEKYEFSDDEPKRQNIPSATPQIDQEQEEDESTMQFLKKLRRNRN